MASCENRDETPGLGLGMPTNTNMDDWGDEAEIPIGMISDDIMREVREWFDGDDGEGVRLGTDNYQCTVPPHMAEKIKTCMEAQTDEFEMLLEDVGGTSTKGLFIGRVQGPHCDGLGRQMKGRHFGTTAVKDGQVGTSCLKRQDKLKFAKAREEYYGKTDELESKLGRPRRGNRDNEELEEDSVWDEEDNVNWQPFELVANKFRPKDFEAREAKVGEVVLHKLDELHYGTGGRWVLFTHWVRKGTPPPPKERDSGHHVDKQVYFTMNRDCEDPECENCVEKAKACKAWRKHGVAREPETGKPRPPEDFETSSVGSMTLWD